jgi:hypothetical protein
VWFARGNQAEVARLVAQIDADTADDRRAALPVLMQKYGASPYAINYVLGKLQATGSAAMTPNGRYNALYYLARTSPLAWTPESARAASQIVEAIARQNGTAPNTLAQLEGIRNVLADAPAPKS